LLKTTKAKSYSNRRQMTAIQVNKPAAAAAAAAAADACMAFSTVCMVEQERQVERYSRHLLLPSFGIAAQGKLCHCKVLIVGCGGLGSPAAL